MILLMSSTVQQTRTRNSSLFIVSAINDTVKHQVAVGLAMIAGYGGGAVPTGHAHWAVVGVAVWIAAASLRVVTYVGVIETLSLTFFRRR